MNKSDTDVANAVSSKLSELKATIGFVFDLLPAPVYCKDTSGVIVCVNQALVETFDIPKTDLEGRTAESLFSETPDHFINDDPDIYRSGRLISDHLMTSPTPSGIRHLRTWKIPLHDSDGQPIGMMGVAMDVTDHVCAQEALRQSESKYRNFFSTSKDCIYITSADGATKEFNDACLEIFGYSREEMAGISVLDLYANPDDRAKVIKDMTAAGAVYRYPVQFRRKDGTVFPGQLTAVVIRDENETIIGFQGTIQDLSSVERASKVQRALEMRLQQTRKMEVVAALAGGIAHDFNNLLFGIMGNVELAMKSAADTQLRQLDRAYRACNDAKELVGRFIAFSKSAPRDPRVNDIVSVIRDAIRFRTEMNHHYTYELRIDGDIPSVAYVYEDMFRMMDNLMSNAENAMPGGGVVTVCLENTTVASSREDGGTTLQPGSHVKIMVSDSGIGIPDEYLEKIFDPYFSTRQQVTEKGRGLGLTIVYAIVKRHNGDIAIQSSPHGTKVTVLLPAAMPAAAPKCT
jgi:two-component system, cell cycle sensor histidine kinase and response regulator CckA